MATRKMVKPLTGTTPLCGMAWYLANQSAPDVMQTMAVYKDGKLETVIFDTDTKAVIKNILKTVINEV